MTDRPTHLLEMEDWVSGKRSYVNLGPHAPYTPDVIAAMDAQEVVKLAAAANAYPATREIDVLFDGPPGPICGRFIETENMDGASIRIGEWIDRGDGMWALRIEVPSV